MCILKLYKIKLIYCSLNYIENIILDLFYKTNRTNKINDFIEIKNR